MNRLVILVFAWCLTVALGSSADEPKKPQWQRMLTGDDAKSAEKLQQQIDELSKKDDYVGAIKVAEGLLELRTKLQGEDHHQTVDTRHQIAAYRKVAELTRDRRQEWHAAVAGALEADRLEAKGQYAEAQPKRHTYLKWCRDVLGEEHPATAAGYHNLAFNLEDRGKDSDVRDAYQKALDIRRKILGEEHPDTATSCTHLASNLNRQGKYEEAQVFLRVALNIRRKVLGEEHMGTATSYNNLAINLGYQGKYREAQPLLHKALDIYRNTLGEEHLATITGYRNLAGNLYSQGKYVEAQPLLHQALASSRKALGDNHAVTPICLSGVANNLVAQGKYVEAQVFYQEALDIRRKMFGDGHFGTVASYSSMAVNLGHQGKYAEAQPLLQKALDMRRKVLGEEHRDTALSYNSMANNLNSQAKYAAAQPLYQKALDIRRKVLGEEHPDTALSYNNMAFNLDCQGNQLEAQPLYQKALEIYRMVLGEEHPDTTTAYNNLALNLNAQRKYTDARSTLERAIHSYESSRLAGAAGLDRASLRTFNPHMMLSVLRLAEEPIEALRGVELSLARGLLDQQSSQTSHILTSEGQSEQAKQRERIATLQPQILLLASKLKRTDTENEVLGKLLKERQDAETRLATLAVEASQRQVADPERIRKAIPPEAALIYWVDVVTKNGDVQEHWVCVVRSTGAPRWERQPGKGPDSKWTAGDSALPEKLRISIAGAAPQAEIESLAKLLHAQRIAPVLKHLDGVKTLHIIPVGDMAGVPVELLVPNLTVSYVSSGTFLASAKARAAPSGQRMLALGDPIFAQPESKPDAPRPLPPGGLLVKQVIPDGVAVKARLQAGDVLLKYGDVELKDIDGLKAAITANEKAASVPVTVWRETADKPFIRDVGSGRLGVILDNDPAPVALANRRKTDALLLALRGGGWKELPGTRVEMDRLSQMFGDQCVTLTDGAASEQGLETLRKSGELSKFRYLHFATHGAGNEVRAFESALILAQDKLPKDALPKAGEPYIDGQLSAAEVLEFWRLDAELVTLSACETAVGKHTSGDGSLGFAQAFLHAGSRSVCLSLWKVDDTATALLMDRFYQNLLGKREGLTKPMGKAAALDEAKRWLRNLSGEEALTLSAKLTKGVARGTRGKDEVLNLAVPSADPKAPPAKDSKPFAHPKYWAAFILIGDPN